MIGQWIEAGGIEGAFKQERAKRVPHDHDAAGFFESDSPIDADREITSAFMEVQLPLLSKLSLKLAARGDHYGAGESIVEMTKPVTARESSCSGVIWPSTTG